MSITIPLNTILCYVAVLLLFIIIVLTTTLNNAIHYYKIKTQKEKQEGPAVKNILLLTGLIFLAQFAFSQDAASADAAVHAAMISKVYTYGFIIVIIVEVLIILFFIKAIRFLTGIDVIKASEVKTTKTKTIWERINSLRPIEDEGDLDTGHSYDGIRELDNVTPPWFTVGFAATIVFALIYMYRYHIAHSAPLQLEEFTVEMKEAQMLQDSMLKLEGNKIDENSVAMLGATDIEAGKKIFTMNCAACHGDKGQGIVGPNLTDEYWLHGGSMKDVFKTIKYGWADKGMKSWKDDFSPNQIAQLTSYVKSLRGSNPPGGKEKQGELFSENVAASDTTAAVKTTGKLR